MQMGWRLWAWFCVVCLVIGGVFAQTAATAATPDPSARIVRVRSGSYSGMCTGYCDNETVVEPGSIRSVSRSFSNKKRFPDIKSRYAITKGDWEDLQHFIDPTVLAAFDKPTGCPGCADHPVEWVEVQFSDGTKKAARFEVAPPPIAALLLKIRSIGAKPKPQHKLRPLP